MIAKNTFDKNRIIFVLIFTTIVVGSVAFCSRVFSYNDTITHPSLTDNVAKVYNANFARKLNSQEIGWLIRGSIEEDLPIRWMNHFYSPSVQTGLWNFLSSKQWAQDPIAQSAYFLSDGNQTWQKALESYAKGDNQTAFIALGHVLHLLEDATVPAHTRLDAHPDGDPYEGWVMDKVGWAINFSVAPVTVSNLNAAFDDLASYSSNNFLSKDTINKNVLNKMPIYFKDIGNDQSIECVKGIINGANFCLIKYKELKSGDAEYVIDDDLVHSDYFSLLGPKAVSYGAGTIKLFFEVAEQKKQEYEQKSWWEKLKDSVNQLLADFSGEIYAGIGISEGAPSDVSGASVSESPEIVPSIVPAPMPSAVPLPANTVVAREKIVVVLPLNTVAAQEKLGGDIVEEVNPQNSKIPPAIIEETIPSQAKLPSPSPLTFLPGGGSAPTPIPSSTPSPSPTPDITPPETTIISQPDSVSSSTTATFEFSSSESVSTFECQLDTTATSSCVSPKEYTGLAEGNHTFKVIATDAAGNPDLTPAGYSWTINLAPEVNLSLSNYSLLNINFIVNWNSSSTDVSYYDVQYKINSGGAWQNWAIATTSVSKTFQASYDNVIYYFRTRAVDVAGNTGDWQEIQAPISLKPIIINEIMYNPNPGSDDYYEYVELYNRSPIAIDLAGWQFVSNNNQILSVDTIHGGSSAVLAVGGLVLITDQVSISSASSTYDGYYAIPNYSGNALRMKIDDADLGLNNSGTTLILKDVNGNVIDQVAYLNSWGANGNGRSLERINYNNLYSQNQSAWQESSANGTPNASNSALNTLAGTLIKDSTIILQNTIWTKAGSPYILYSNSGAYPTLASGVTLIIEPGVTIKPQNKNYYSLYVRGTLKAQGSEAEQIMMTSLEASPQAGDWGTGIYFHASSTGSSLSYVTFEYGGFQPVWPGSAKAAVVVEGSKVDFSNIVFRSSQARALDLLNSDSAVNNSRFSSSTEAALSISGSSTPIIFGNVFQNSGHVGIAIKIDNQAKPQIESNNISGFDIAVWLESAYPNISSNTLTNNANNGIYVSDYTIISKNTTWQNGNVYLLLSNSGQYPTVATSTTLTLEPGVIIKPLNEHYTALKIEGSLMADGNSSSTLINFTSFKDDLLGGDSNNDGSLTNAISTVGDWKNIWFVTGSQSVLKFVRFQFGGFNSGGGIYWRIKEESLKIDAGARVLMEEIGVE